jgi:hypothetical protein
MYEFMRLLKRKALICNEIMIFFRSPKPMVNNQKPYSNEDWHPIHPIQQNPKDILRIYIA